MGVKTFYVIQCKQQLLVLDCKFCCVPRKLKLCANPPSCLNCDYQLPGTCSRIVDTSTFGGLSHICPTVNLVAQTCCCDHSKALHAISLIVIKCRKMPQVKITDSIFLWPLVTKFVHSQRKLMRRESLD